MNHRLEPARIDLTREAPFTLGALTANPATREVAVGAERTILEPRVMQVLTLLARHRDAIVTRDELIAACWEGRAVGDDAINRCTGRLRRLAEAFGGFALETIPRVGYRLAESAVAAPPSPPVLGAFKLHKRSAAAVLGLLVVAVAIFLAARSVQQSRAPLRQAIAVLPFTPLAADPGTRLFGDRVASAMAGALSKMGEPVVPTAESFQYRGSAKARAARELNALYVIDGEVVRDNGKVRVSLHVDDTKRGTTLFAHSFEEAEARADALPDRAAGYIASMTWGADITLWSQDKAPGLLRTLEQQKRGDFFAAYESARVLAAAYPDDPAIQNIFAWTVVNLISYVPSARNAARVAEARRAAEKMLQRQPGDGNIYALYAWLTPSVLWGEREAYLRKSLAAAPGSVGVLMLQTWVLNETGRPSDAETNARSAYERFSYHENSAQRLIEQQLTAGNAAGARQTLSQARRLWPENAILLNLGFEAAAFQGSPADAEAFLKDPAIAPYLTGDRRTIWPAIVRALKSRRAADIDALTRDCITAREVWWSCMVAQAKLGRLETAFSMAATAYPDLRAKDRAALERKWLAGADLSPTRYLFIPAAAPMRADLRFQELVERVGLLAYWQASHRPPDFCATEPAPVCRLIH